MIKMAEKSVMCRDCANRIYRMRRMGIIRSCSSSHSGYSGWVLFFVLTLAIAVMPDNSMKGQDNHVPLRPDGIIQFWLVAGPFEQPVVWPNVIVDEDAIGEKNSKPFAGKEESKALSESGKTSWQVQSVNPAGFLDLNASLGWVLEGKSIEKHRHAKTGYACTYLISEHEEDALLLIGSNSRCRIWVNHDMVYTLAQERNARPDQDTVKIHLMKGRNNVLIKTGNSYLNYYLPFWGGIDWKWGFFARLLSVNKDPLKDVYIETPETSATDAVNMMSTFFFKNKGGRLLQRFDIELNRRISDTSTVNLSVMLSGNRHQFVLDSLQPGKNRRSVWLPALEKDEEAKANLSNSKKIFTFILKKQEQYRLHLMLTSHMDIGYTHTQPVVDEIHLNVLDDVIRHCEKDTLFHWTIEAMRLLTEYQQNRPAEQFQKLITFIREGRVAVSPVFSNPFTGWISEGELFQSFTSAAEFHKKYRIPFNGMLFNDTPGLNWIMPQALRSFGVTMLVCGLNEIYGGYRIQSSLPKVFDWQGSDGSMIVTYLCEGYSEGRTYGLEKNSVAIENRLWHRLHQLQSAGYHYDLVLLNSAMTDNAGIPEDQYVQACKWNEEYEFPKFVISDLNTFAKEFNARYCGKLPVKKGDWTSDWDILSQGEPARMMLHRETQTALQSAGKLSALAWHLNPANGSLQDIIDRAYASLLKFSGHGSGLEYGYGSPQDNDLTFAFRENYVRDAWLGSQEAMQRAVHRITEPQVALIHEGVIVFNTLSWTRHSEFEIQLTEQDKRALQIVDLSTGEHLPSYRDGYKIICIAREIPALGYKKFVIRPDDGTNQAAEGLASGEIFIENQFYRIETDRETKSIKRIIDKKSGRDYFSQSDSLRIDKPLFKQFTDNKFSGFPTITSAMTIIDQRPVRLILKLDRPGELFESSEFILWNNLNRLDIQHNVNLEKLVPPLRMEEYAMAFPFSLSGWKARVGILGGYADPFSDHLVPPVHQAYSVRNGISVMNALACLDVASRDCRIIRLTNEPGQGTAILANLVNNFPKDWNRREVNEGVLSYHFSVRIAAENISEANSARFGWEFNTPVLLRRSYYTGEPSQKTFMTIQDKNLIILDTRIFNDSQSVALFFMNTGDKTLHDVAIESELFNGAQIFLSNLAFERLKPVISEDNRIKLDAGPYSICVVICDNNVVNN